MNSFSGSYPREDVEFLLNPIEIKMTSVEEKEMLIQSGLAHYSDMLSQEPEPSEEHIYMFNKAIDIGAQRLADEVLILANALSKEYVNRPIVLVSLVRAGVPLGVLIHRSLKDLGHESYHYGISIIRDRGIDDIAMKVIEAKHDIDSIVFVDGWTGKGAISKQLTESLTKRNGYPANPKLVVLADPCGMAWLSASHEDWLIPFGILGAPVSGLVSRSVWSSDNYHGCVLCNHLEKFDCSEHFVDRIHGLQNYYDRKNISNIKCREETKDELQTQSLNVINYLMKRYSIDKINRIKPGIAEATRAVLRRVPDQVLVRNKNDHDVQLLVMLAEKKGIIVEELGSSLGQYRAVTIIKKVL
ncbi:cysteine protease StiP family protein [Vibrio owensii]|uniref:cysteine protease StiP family protein n=1 Tax=Vibrio owensii TaxID=696485 RepID=UPI0005EE4BAB|nr:cysteine protease StiP family protein [Vibrio owensii]